MENNGNDLKKPSGGFFKQLAAVVLIGSVIGIHQGAAGFIETLLLVFGGTFLLAWAAYPLKELFSPSGPKPVLYAADCAAAMGALTTIPGMILMLASVDDVTRLPLRMALAFSGVFFGLLISEVLLAPAAARLAARAGRVENGSGAQFGARKRVFIGLLVLTIALLAKMTVLYALNASLRP